MNIADLTIVVETENGGTDLLPLSDLLAKALHDTGHTAKSVLYSNHARVVLDTDYIAEELIADADGDRYGLTLDESNALIDSGKIEQALEATLSGDWFNDEIDFLIREIVSEAQGDENE